MAKLSKPKTLERIEACITTLTALKNYVVELEANADKDEDFMQDTLDYISDVAQWRIDSADKSPVLEITFRQDGIATKIVFDVIVETEHH